MTAATLTTTALLLLGFCVTAETVQQLAFKVGNGRAEAAKPPFARAIVFQPLIWLGLFLWVVESIAWVHVLQRAPLSMAYPVMTATYATVPLAGLVLLKEKMTGRQKLGALLIFAGVLAVGISGA
jgi:drug/metabolite transporter (DMT)-like permease